MKQFNNLTIRAAVDIVAQLLNSEEMDMRSLEWGIPPPANGAYKSAKKAIWLKVAVSEEPFIVLTKHGHIGLDRALVELALTAHPKFEDSQVWIEMIAGLKFDGYELQVAEDGSRSLVAMLPTDAPGLDMREADDEVTSLLKKHDFLVSLGHWNIAKSTFQRGEWTAANGELRKIIEGLLNEIAERLGCDPNIDSKGKRDFLGNHATPFLLAEYNEWNVNNQKPQYVQGLMSRMHPHGGHPGLSEEEDATFRLQITLVTARLLLRRFEKRVG